MLITEMGLTLCWTPAVTLKGAMFGKKKISKTWLTVTTKKMKLLALICQRIKSQ